MDSAEVDTHSDRTTHVIFEPLDFIGKLAALVPKPRVNLTRFARIIPDTHPLRGPACIRRINAHFARVQQQLTVNGPPLHHPIILSTLRIPRISSRNCLCFLHLSPPSQPPGKPGPCRGSRYSVLGPAPDLIRGHGGPALSRRWWFIGYPGLVALAPFGRGYQGAMLAVRQKHPVKAANHQLPPA